MSEEQVEVSMKSPQAGLYEFIVRSCNGVDLTPDEVWAALSIYFNDQFGNCREKNDVVH